MNTEYATLSVRVLMLIANDKASKRQATMIVPNRPAVFHLPKRVSKGERVRKRKRRRIRERKRKATLDGEKHTKTHESCFRPR